MKYFIIVPLLALIVIFAGLSMTYLSEVNMDQTAYVYQVTEDIHVGTSTPSHSASTTPEVIDSVSTDLNEDETSEPVEPPLAAPLPETEI